MANSEDPHQTAKVRDWPTQLHRLIRAFVVQISTKADFSLPVQNTCGAIAVTMVVAVVKCFG